MVRDPLFFLTLFAVLIILSNVKAVHPVGRFFSLFRVLVPSWRFFEDVCEMPVLHFRLRIGEGEFGEWEEGIYKPKRSWTNLFFNPEGNLYLAKESLLQQVESDIGELTNEESEKFFVSPSYRLLRNLVLFEIRNRHSLSLPLQYQFRLTRVLQGSTVPLEVFLVSPIEEM